MTVGIQPSSPPGLPPAPASTQSPAPFGDDGLTFRDLIDLVNPLHHIPILGNLYRRFTGDVIDPAMRIAGGALFGGPLGAGFAAASVAVKHVMSMGKETGDDATPVDHRHVPAPGGWLVATQRPARFLPAPQSAEPDRAYAARATARRGGWMAQAAYAMADARAREAAEDSLRERIDTTA